MDLDNLTLVLEKIGTSTAINNDDLAKLPTYAADTYSRLRSDLKEILKKIRIDPIPSLIQLGDFYIKNNIPSVTARTLNRDLSAAIEQYHEARKTGVTAKWSPLKDAICGYLNRLSQHGLISHKRDHAFHEKRVNWSVAETATAEIGYVDGLTVSEQTVTHWLGPFEWGMENGLASGIVQCDIAPIPSGVPEGVQAQLLAQTVVFFPEDTPFVASSCYLAGWSPSAVFRESGIWDLIAPAIRSSAIKAGGCIPEDILFGIAALHASGYSIETTTETGNSGWHALFREGLVDVSSRISTAPENLWKQNHQGKSPIDLLEVHKQNTAVDLRTAKIPKDLATTLQLLLDKTMQWVPPQRTIAQTLSTATLSAQADDLGLGDLFS